MAQELKAGARLRSTACATEVVVVKAPAVDVELRCGGAPVVAAGPDVEVTASLDPALNEGTLLGKRYTDDESGIELLAVKGGEGSLSVDGRPLTIKGAKPLPSSD